MSNLEGQQRQRHQNQRQQNARHSFSLSPDERRLVDIYIQQYNQANVQINRLYNTLDNIRSNINYIIRNNIESEAPAMPRNRNIPSNLNSNINNLFNNQRFRPNNQYVYYDYNTPINPTTYISNDSNNRNTSTADNLDSLLSVFLASSVLVRPTSTQITNATRSVRFSDINNPVSNSCPISLETFSTTDQVRQIIHCGHIFSQISFDEWFRNNVRCPVCRYDIRDYRATPTTTPTPTTTTTTARHIYAEDDESDEYIGYDEMPHLENATTTATTATSATTATTNTRETRATRDTDNILDRFTTSLFESLLSYPSRSTSSSTNNERIFYDPSYNTITYETVLRPRL